MAEAVVSIALETFRDLLLEEGRLLSGVGDEVKALQMQLKEMKCLLEDADRRRHENKTIANWIAEIRDLAYSAEDVIETYAAQMSSKRGRGLKKLLKKFSSLLNFKECYSLHQLGSEMSQIKSELERVGKSMQEYGIRSILQGESSTSDNQQWERQTFPDFQIEDCFVGKEDELKEIVSLAVDDNEHRVLSIWGMGGIGKTTIARKVYHHPQTKRYFQCFAWVCITQQCQIRSVLEDVLKQLCPLRRDVISSLSNTELIGELCGIQKAKRCIIVLDDLWENDHWNGLKHAFLVQGLKSKILVTTRNQRVAEIGFAINVALLSMDSSWELLKKKAFPHTSIPDFAFEEKLLRKIGKEMVQKCGYLPLAICLLGGILSKRKSMREWELVKENINAYIYRGDGIEKEKEIDTVLNLSYEDLPYYLKPCFLYMGLFKEDEIVPASNVYGYWIAQGMISPRNQEKESLVDVAELYLSELASRSIVQVVVDQEFIPGRKYRECKLHDVVRGLCLSMGKKEDFGIQILDYRGGKLSTLMHESLSCVKTRHLSIYFDTHIELELDRGEFIARGEDTRKHVRSLLLHNDVKWLKIEFPESAFDLQSFKSLRVLVFVRFIFQGKKFPKGIENLLHLRQLQLIECVLDELPSSISKLSYLDTLDLIHSQDVQVPKNVLKKMFRLKHLYLPSYFLDYKLGDRLLELEGLEELESLHGFDSSMHQLKSITRMKNLRSFGARVRDNESLSAVLDAITTKWNNLQFASVIINRHCQFTSTDEGLMVFKKVFTCPNLHQLAITIGIGKRLDECRSQVTSSKLVRLYLTGNEIEDDPMEILGKLPVLRILHLWSRSFVGEEMTCHASCFPRLKELVLDSLPNLREWRVEQGAMPLLSEIAMTNCLGLMMVPDGLRFIATLQKLTVTRLPYLGKRVLASEDNNGVEGEDYDKVRHVPSINIIN